MCIKIYRKTRKYRTAIRVCKKKLSFILLGQQPRNGGELAVLMLSKLNGAD
jgi:hypothetical protein